MKINWYEHLSSPAAITGPVHKKEFIAIHWYGDPNTAGDVHATARYLSGVSHASVNFVGGTAGGEGHVYCLVNPTQIAYGQGDGGDGYGNKHGISIECDPRMRSGDLEVTAQIVAKVRRDFGINFPLRPHKHFTNTACPGTYEAKLQWISDRANQINGQINAAPAPVKPAQPGPKAPTAYVPDAHWLVEKGETLSDVAEWMKVPVNEIAKFNGIKDPNVIRVGERLWSPRGRFDTYTVDPGNTLSSIVNFYKTKHGHKNLTVQKLQYANGINDVSKVPVGLRLVIPA